MVSPPVDPHAAPPPQTSWSPLRDEEQRPGRRTMLARGLLVAVANAVALLGLAALFDGFDVEEPWQALLAGAVVGVTNALVWPAVALLVVPLSVLTLGIGAILVNAVVIGLVLDQLPGIRVDGLGTAVALTLAMAAITALLGWALALDDDAWFDEQMIRQARRRRPAVPVTDVPGVVFLQIDGLAEPVLRRALRSGDVPTLHRWLHQGSHRLRGWETEWSSQTGVSQCGLLHGSTVNMPAFRWLDRATGTIVVSNRPASAQAIERSHSDGKGLLAHDGSSYGNLFTGDAERAALTMSVVAKVKEGRIGAGYGGYFARPDQAARTLVRVVVEVARERRAASEQRRRGVEPRVERNRTYALLRAFTTVVSRDVCVRGVLQDVAEGRAAIYADLLGYDEVSHHSGPERVDTLAVLRDIDRQVGRVERAAARAPRPYRVVVLSDHGQTQGATFEDRYGETLAALVSRLLGVRSSTDPDSDAGRTESSAWLRQARSRAPEPTTSGLEATVLASGNLGLVYLPGARQRLTLAEIEQLHPELLEGLATHPGVGFVLVRDAADGGLVIGPRGRVRLSDGLVTGDDPLQPFGPSALAKLQQVDGYENVADLMVNSFYDAELDEVAAFEHQVGSHGGLGGPQTKAFILAPEDLPLPEAPIIGPVAMHRIMKSWLAHLGHPVTVPEEEHVP